MKITAQHLPPDSNTKTVYLTVRFFIPDRNNRPQESSQKFRIRLDVSDSTPSQVSTLDQLLLFDGENNPVEFAFSPDQKNYTGNARMLHIPYKVKEFTLTPTLTDARGAGTPIKIEVQDVKGAPANKIKGDKNATEVLNGRTSEPIVLTLPRPGDRLPDHCHLPLPGPPDPVLDHLHHRGGAGPPQPGRHPGLSADVLRERRPEQPEKQPGALQGGPAGI